MALTYIDQAKTKTHSARTEQEMITVKFVAGLASGTGNRLDDAIEKRKRGETLDWNDYRGIAMAIVGDGLMFFSGGLTRTGKLTLEAKFIIGIELALAGVSGIEGWLAIQDGENEKAAGYFGEATLRLLGVSVTAIQRLRAAQKVASIGSKVPTIPLTPSQLRQLQASKRLNAGGQHQHPAGQKSMRPAQPADFTIDIDPATKPNVVGSIEDIILPKNSVQAAIIERVPYQRITPQVIENYGGAVRPGGKLTIETSPLINSNDVLTAMRKAGFKDAKLLPRKSDQHPKVFEGTKTE